MRRFELLVNEVRESTDTTDINSLGVYELMRYFNDGQKQIQKIIFSANPSADIFVKASTYSIAGTGTKENNLPFDIYAHNSVVSLNTLNGGSKLTRLSNTERTALYGYALVDKQFILGFDPQENLVLNYVYKLPIISYRLGQVTAKGAGTLTVNNTISNEGFTGRYDNYSVVNSQGVQTGLQLELTSWINPTFTLVGDITGVAVGDWVVCGNNGTSHSSLPEECEPFLMSYVQRRILNKISSTEVASENIFTQEERGDIEDLFKDNVKDALYPVSSDTDYLGY